MEKMTQNTTNSADSGSKIASFKAKQNMPYDFKDVPEEYAQMQIEQMKNQENTAD